MALVLIPTLAACSFGDSASTGGEPIAWRESKPDLATAPANLPQAPATPVAVGGPSYLPDVRLSIADLQRIQPDELGKIPVLMYHGFTHDPQYLDTWTVTYDQFRGDLKWLYDHNFYVVSMDNLLHNEISAPPGKHPVVLTFDDASSGQFRLLKDATGKLSPDPQTAVGVMEEFFAAHADFGRGGFFALLPYNCFHHADEQSTCEERLTWLANHGYEIGNHTWEHRDLSNVTDDELERQVALTADFINQRVSGKANQSRVLVLPYGAWPSQAQRAMLQKGFTYGGQTYYVSSLMSVEGGLSPSPSSSDWSRWFIRRFNTDRDTLEGWESKIDDHEVTLFTSDGNPSTVTIPNQIPDDLADQFDADWAQAYDMELIRYDKPGSSSNAIPDHPAADRRKVAV